MTRHKAGSCKVYQFTGNHSREERPFAQQRPIFKKPIEIYSFIDPLCPECWALEPILKKLHIECGNYFKLVHLIGGKLNALNLCGNGIQQRQDLAKKWERTANRTGMSCDGSIWLENPVDTPYSVSLAIKAAEFQGKKAGARFLRKIREFLFLDKQNISKKDVLMKCAKAADLDVFEFEKDLFSENAVKAFQCDMKISKEMDVNECPTLVFFNENVDEAGIKVTGVYSYDVYVDILSSILNRDLERNEPPSLERFLKTYEFVATKEISVVYDMSQEDVEREMKKLVLKQKVERVPVKYGTFWRYVH